MDAQLEQAQAVGERLFKEMAEMVNIFTILK